MGTRYSGFQVQENANTVQAEVEKALQVFFRMAFELTGSSRTDAGVHALQNFFHFDTEVSLPEGQLVNAPYHLNAILPEDIVVKSLAEVDGSFHCRFDAVSREYHYFIYRSKDPFLQDRAYYFPYRLDVSLLGEAAAIVLQHTHFEAFSKKHHQAKTYECRVMKSSWEEDGEGNLVYRVEASRFLRGMVRGLVGTMLRVGTGKLDPAGFSAIIESGEQSRVDFSVPARGLFLVKVNYAGR